MTMLRRCAGDGDVDLGIEHAPFPTLEIPHLGCRNPKPPTALLRIIRMPATTYNAFFAAFTHTHSACPWTGT